MLQLVARERERLGKRVLLVLNHPGKELDGRGERTDTGRRAGGRSERRRRPGSERAPDRRGHQQGAKEVRAATLVLLRAFLAVLVCPDGDVLRAVVLGQVRPAQGNGRGPDREHSSDCLLSGDREPAPPNHANGCGTPDHRCRNRGPLEGELGGGQAASDLRQKRKHLGHPCGTANEAVLDLGGAKRLETGGDLEISVVVANRAGPVARAVHEHAVGEGHPAEPNLVPAHSPSVRATCMRKRVPSSRSSTGIRSSAEWMSAAATSESIARMGKKP